MIFATVGTQLPFDRLVQGIDRWAERAASAQVFAQTGRGAYKPRNIDWSEQLTQEQFLERLSEASVVVAHAGIGTILSALELGKPVVVLPRRADRGEHRNDHQLATARRFEGMGLVSVAGDEDDLIARLDRVHAELRRDRLPTTASPRLLDFVSDFIATCA